jgi:hypothetical protein
VVLVAPRSTLRRRRAAIVRALAGIARGARILVADPALATRVITRAAGGDARLLAAQTAALAGGPGAR